jgi:hypothetical protein
MVECHKTQPSFFCPLAVIRMRGKGRPCPDFAGLAGIEKEK